jgi:hypothetical protein
MLRLYPPPPLENSLFLQLRIMRFFERLTEAVWAFCLTLSHYPIALKTQLDDYRFRGADTIFSGLQGPSNVALPCFNSPQRRDCWDALHNIHTDYEKHTPNTGVVRHVSRMHHFSNRY